MRSSVTRLTTRLIVFAGLLAFSAVFALAQEQPRVVVTKAGDDELRRTAYRLRLCPEQLQNARQAMAEARALAPEVAGDVWLGDLAQLLNRFDREHAPAILAELLGQLADRAGEADGRSYQQITSSAQMLLGELREKDPDAAAEIVRTWPQSQKEEPGRFFAEHMKKSLASEQFNGLGRSDPIEAMRRLPEYEGGKLDLQARANLLHHLLHAGAEEEAGRLLDDSVAATLQRGLDPNAAYSFGELFSTTAWAFPDRLSNLFSQFQTVLGGMPDGTNQLVVVGEKRVSVSSRENFVLSVARSLGSRPDTVNRLLSLLPGLRQKLEPLGGIDAVLSPGRPPRPPMTSPSMIAEWRSGAVSEASIARLESQQSNPQEFIDVMQAARSLCERDPARAVPLFEQAGGILAKKGDMQAVNNFQFLIGVCLDCEGTLSPRMVELGNELVTRLREELSPDVAPPSDPQAPRQDPRFAQEQANRFEGMLIAAQAIEDFGRAMDLAAAHPDPKARYQAYIQIVQHIAR